MEVQSIKVNGQTVGSIERLPNGLYRGFSHITKMAHVGSSFSKVVHEVAPHKTIVGTSGVVSYG